MKNTTNIIVKKNGYSPPKGLYRLVFPYLSTLQKVKFEEKDGKLGTYHDDMFYPMDSIFWANEGSEIPLQAYHKTEIGKKIKEDQIIIELDDYFIVQNNDNYQRAEG
jgi:hypothetical protein